MTEFHFGKTPESDAFFERHPNFYSSFEDVMRLTNSAFGRSYAPANRLQDVAFNLGETCRVDFSEVTFLAVHGFGIGALKILRGLYERTVALAFMVKHPEKAERFVRFGAIQEYKMMVAALKQFSEEDFDRAMSGRTTAAQIKEDRESAKSEFQVEICKNCHEVGTASSWDRRSVIDQAQDVGGSYPALYLGAYVIPNLHVHASLLSAFPEERLKPEAERPEERRRDADLALMNAGALLLLTIRSQDALFQLALEDDIQRCEDSWVKAWS